MLFRSPVLLQAIYIRHTRPFPEVDDFVATTSKEYHLDLATSDKPMKQALADYLQEMYEVKAVFVGTRRTDPHGADLIHFQETDGDWPRFMRIHPVIDWHYREVWGVSLFGTILAVSRNFGPRFERATASYTEEILFANYITPF